MDDPVFVRRVECIGDLRREPQHLVDRKRSARDQLCQILAVDELHHECPTVTAAVARHHLDAVDLRDVRMIERGKRPCFSFEAGQPIRVGGEKFWEDFQGDVTLWLRIARPVNFAHPPHAYDRDDFVEADSGARGEAHFGMRGL